jgi:hypothetical protein
MRAILLLVGLLVGLVVVVTTFGVDEGEVVNLTTVDANGARFETQVWIVEIDGVSWLRAGRPRAKWLARLRANPAVELERGEEVKLYTAIPVDDPSARDAVNRAMAEKYGDADRMVDRIFDRQHSVPIRLEARAGEPPAAPRGPHS